MRRYPSYLAYRPSGVDWLGDIPQGWEVKPVFALYSRRVERGHTEAMLLSVYRDYGVIPRDERDDNFNRPSLDLSAYQLVKPRDLVLNKMKTWQGSLAVSKHSGIVSPAYIICRPNHREYDRFLHYLLRSPAYIAQYSRLSYGVRVAQWDMRFEDFRRVQVLLPSLSEQRSIADFLDRETARIDALIARKQRLIELLQEKRTALISHAVTKGLDAGVAMKDSGVAWIGEVPAHWDVVRMRYLAKITTGGKDTQDAEVDGSYPFFVRSDTIERSSTYSFDGEAVLTSGDGAGVGKIFHHYVGKLEYHQRVYLFSNFRQVIGRYLYYFIAANLFKVVLALSAKSTVDSIRLPMLQNFPISFGPRAEQEAIVEYLDLETKRLDDIAHQLERNLQLLQEYRTALISAAVTGKIDVRKDVVQ